MDIETRSALLDKQLADLEARLKQSENEALRGQLDLLKQQNDQLRTQADSARKQSDALTQRLTTSAPAPAPTTPKDLSIFYERLAPHGRWIDVSGHAFSPASPATAPGVPTSMEAGTGPPSGGPGRPANPSAGPPTTTAAG
jgi:TolA-binding protein